MVRRVLFGLGGLLAAVGLGAGLVSLALPWAHYQVRGSAFTDVPVARDANLAVFQVAGGAWYVLAVLILAALLAVAALGAGPGLRVAAVAGPVLGLVTLGLVLGMTNQVLASSHGVLAAGFAEVAVNAANGPGTGYALAAGPLLGFGIGLLAAVRAQGTTG